MKKIVLLFSFLLVFCIGVFSQNWSKFSGIWEGKIKIDGKDANISLRIKIDSEDELVYQYFSNSSGGWDLVAPDTEDWECYGDNMTYFWINTGGIWSETQCFSMTLIDSWVMSVRWMRHVNNRASGKTGEDWYLTGGGRLYLK